MHTIYSHPNEVCSKLYNYLISVLIIGLIIFGLFFVASTLASIGDRHELIAGKTYVAKHVYLPGYNTVYEPEHHMNLGEWVGSQLAGVSITEKTAEAATTNTTPKHVPEAEAGVALLATGAFSGYALKPTGGGHYELYKPANSYTVFTTEHPYRIGAWKLAPEEGTKPPTGSAK